VEAVKGLSKRHDAEALLEISGMALPPDVGVAIMEAAADLGKDEDVESRMRMRFKELLTAHATADRSERVRAEAISGLGKMKASDRLAIIAQAANAESQNDRVRQAAIGALAELESPDGLPIVLRYTQPGTYNRTRAVAIDGAVKLAKYGPDVVYSTLASMLEDREARARNGAGAALAQLGDKRALDDLAKLKDSRRDPRDKTTVEGWIDAAKKKLGVEAPKATASLPGAGFLWVPMAEPSRWATSEGDKELLAKSPEAFFARFGLITGSYQGTEYLCAATARCADAWW
jgi:HEAT repeat protein